MKEIIQSQDGYESFIVSSGPHADDKGENRVATGRGAVIVEAAFHSNALDAAALLDPVFQIAAMKGVEKGARLYVEGEPCVQFEITDVPSLEQPWSSSASTPLPIEFEGYPQFPVEAKFELVDNPASQPTRLVFEEEEDSPLVAALWCRMADHLNPPTVVQNLRVTLTDVDNVETEPFDFTWTCRARPPIPG